METIDIARLKSGEVNLGVSLTPIVFAKNPMLIYFPKFRPRSWPFSSKVVLLSAQTVEQLQAATLCDDPLLHSLGAFAQQYIAQANRVTDKLTHVHDRIYCCRSGSAADTQAIADIVHYYLQIHTYVSPRLTSYQTRISSVTDTPPSDK